MFIQKTLFSSIIFLSLHSYFAFGSDPKSKNQKLTEYQRRNIEINPAVVIKYSINNEAWRRQCYVEQSTFYITQTIVEKVFKNNKIIAERQFTIQEKPDKNLYEFFIEALNEQPDKSLYDILLEVSNREPLI